VPENVDFKDKKFLTDLKSQMFPLFKKFMIDPEYSFMLNGIQQENKWNVEGKLCADIYQYIESNILTEVFNYLSSVHIDTKYDVKMYDGFQHYPKGSMTDTIINDINTHIFKKTGIPVKFVIKPFEKIIDTTNMSNDNIKEMFSSADNYAEQKYSFEKNYAKVINNSLFIRTDGTDFKAFSESKLIVSFKHLSYLGQKETKKGNKSVWKPVEFLKEWLVDPKMRTYDNMGMYPPPLKCPNNDYNLWLPFVAENIPQLGNDLDAVEFFKNHIHIMCNREETITNTILNWCGQMMQYPSIKTFIPTFISKQGGGKGSWLEIMGKIIGEGRIVDTPKPSQFVFGDFNGCMANAYLVCMNEMSKKEMNDAEGYFKTLITDPYVWINPKGIESYKIQSFHRFVVFSNNDDPVKTSADDRRNLIIRCSDELCDKDVNKEYWKRMRQIIEDPNAIKSIYNYLMSIPNLDTFHHNALPKTEYQQDIITKNEPIQLQFVKWLVSNDQYKHNNSVVAFKAEQLMMQFKIFKEKMNLEGYKELSANSLIMLIKNQNIVGITKQKTKICNNSLYDMKAIRSHFCVEFIPEDEETEEFQVDS